MPLPNDPFLSQVAELYLREEADNLIDYCFVTPNKRAAVFLSKYFSDIFQREKMTGFLPEVSPIADFVSGFSTLVEAPRIRQLLVLYRVYSRVLTARSSAAEIAAGKNLVDFNRFQFWGDILLNDFNDVDRYMVDTKQLFQNVERLKEISANFLTPEQIKAIEKYWNVEGLPDPVKEFWRHISYKSETDMGVPHSDKKNVAGFLKLWQVMEELYLSFREELAANGLTYPGKSYRDAAEEIDRMDRTDFTYKRYIFVGFNVLSASEKHIFSSLRSKGLADFYWDFASPEFKIPSNRASRFLRNNLRDFPSLYPGVGSTTINYYPDITVMPVPSAFGQTKLVPDILRKLYPGFFDSKVTKSVSDDEYEEMINSLARTAIVLPDESLAQPLLSALPVEIPVVNVTMGFSLRHTGVATLLRNIISLQLRAREVKSHNTFFFDDVIAVLSHPLIRLKYAPLCDSIVAQINRRRLFNVPVDMLAAKEYEALAAPFRVVTNAMNPEAVLDYLADLLHWLIELIESVSKKSVFDSDDEGEPLVEVNGPVNLELQFIRGYLDAVEQLRSLREEFLSDVFIEDKTVFHLVERIVGNQTVNYEGLPLRGLQVMGVLESRCLDFDNIILTSMNERVFPRKHYSKSFIPNALRRGYGMATLEHQESIYAYYFYRLITRAKNVFLLYDARKTGIHSGGASRYIKQLRYQFPPEKVSVLPVSSPLRKAEQEPVMVSKNERIMRELNRFRSSDNARYLSASSLNAYITCPLSFYIANVERYYPENDFVDYMDDGTYGTVLHDAVAKMYKDERGDAPELLITPEIVEKFSRKGYAENYVTRSIKENYLKVSPDDPAPLIGDTAVYRQIMSRTIRRMLERELEMGQKIYFVDAEHQIKIPFKVSPEHTINLSYTIDRVDRVEEADGTSFYRIVDYKTGGDIISAPSLDRLFDNTDKSRPKAIFQLMLYAAAFADHEDYDGRIQPFIYQLRKVMINKMTPIKVGGEPITDYRDFIGEYLGKLSLLLDDIFSPDKPFVADPGDRNHNCHFCKFKEICGIPNS